MVLPLTPAPETERMTARARGYLAIVASRHLVLGALCASRPEHFTSGSYDGIKDSLPLVTGDGAMVTWGFIFIVVGILNVIPVVTGRETYARAGLLVNVVVTGFWVGGFISAQITGSSAGPSGLIIWASVVAKDLTMLRDPLRNPFEPIVKQMMSVRRGR